MLPYDPDSAPNPAAWLALGEDERTALVTAHHEGLEDALHPAGGNETVHATLHQVIETHLASGAPVATGATLSRLLDEGMRRHAAVHMLAEALAADLLSMMVEGRSFSEDRWAQRLEALEPAAWIAREMHRNLTD